MLDWLTTLTNEGIALARIVIILVAIVSVIITYYRTQALVPVLGSVLVAGIAIWAVSPAGITQLENWIGQDANDAAPAVVDVGFIVDDVGGGDPSQLVVTVDA